MNLSKLIEDDSQDFLNTGTGLGRRPLVTLKPTQSTQQPTQSTLKSTQSTQQPTQSTLKPTQSTQQPTQSTQKPTQSTQQPAQSTQKSTQVTSQPTPQSKQQIIQQLKQSSGRPVIYYEEDIFINPAVKQKNNNIAAILLIFLVIIIIIIAFYITGKKNINSFKNSFQRYNPLESISINDVLPQPKKINTDPLQEIKDPYPIERMYYSEQVDPIVTGNLYQNVNNLRPVYTQRTAFGLPKWDTQYASANGNYGYKAPTGQLSEFNSSGSSGDVGVTVGPLKYDKISSISVGPVVFPTNYDDGIPSEWDLPSTPMLSYYESHIPTEDYYGPEGPTPYSLKGFRMPFEQDNEPLMN